MSSENKTMNDLLRQSAPITASTPIPPATNDPVNQWHRESVQEKQEQRFSSLWARLMSAHAAELEWEERLASGENPNG